MRGWNGWTPWTGLWNHANDIATGAPEVIARRMVLMQSPGGFTPAAAIEVQAMVLEKMHAMAESWWALCRAAHFSAWPVMDPTTWWHPVQHERLANHAVNTARLALAPVSERVNDNVRRLRAQDKAA